MSPAFAVIALQGIVSVPISSSISVAPSYERATVAAGTVSAQSAASTSIAQAQVAATAQAEENITVRRGATIRHERAPKGQPIKKP